jgi:pimeloyl-ACP methyl ester carboxylesterase
MLRGLGRTLSHWVGVHDELQDRFRVVLLDNRGVGRSGVPLVPFDTGDMAADVVRVLDHAAIPRAHVFGTSLGGMIAQRVAIDHPARVDRLVLGCTTPGGPEAERTRVRTMVRLALQRLGSSETAVGSLGELLLTQSFVRAHPEVIERWVTLDRELPVNKRVLIYQLRAALSHDTADELHRITAPTLVLSADRDDLVPPSNSRLLARRVRGAELAWVAGARHDFPTERPRETARIVTEFLLGDAARDVPL